MKIAFIIENFPVLSQTFILDQITSLIDLGAEVRIFAESRGDLGKVHPDVTKYQLDDLIFYSCDIPQSKLYRFLKGVGVICRGMCRDPLAVSKFLMKLILKKYKTPLRLLCQIASVYDGEFDIIHCHFGPVGNRAAVLKEFGIKAKLIVTFHGYDLSRYLLTHGSSVYEELFNYGDLFLPISEHWKKKLMEIGCDEKKIVVHRMGIDVHRFEYREKKRISGEPVRLLTIGRLTEKKGQDYVIKSLSELSNKGYNFVYTIAGAGPHEEHLKSLAVSLGLGEKVNFTGPVSRDMAIELYNRGDVFVLASVTAADGDQEGIPVVLMEAMACGLPVVSTLHTGIPELVEDGNSGFLVPEKDCKALTERLEYLIKNPQLWSEMGKCGHDFVHKNYEIKTLTQMLLEIYKDVLNCS